jgi:hypothetical protein
MIDATGLRTALLLAALLAPPYMHAQAAVVIYRCTNAAGAVTFRNDRPCSKGSQQKREVLDTPAPAPAYRPPPPEPVVAPPSPQVEALPSTPPSASSKIADADRLPPPALYQCNTYDNDSYLSEDPTPAPRCVRLQTTNLQGAADDSAGVACQMVTDQCQRIADGAACDAWKRRLRETEAAWTFGVAADADTNRAAFERVQTIVRDSTCGK